MVLYIRPRDSILVRVAETWVVLAQFLNLLLSHALGRVIQLPSRPASILATEVGPEEHINDRRHCNQTHRDRVALDKLGTFVCLI